MEQNPGDVVEVEWTPDPADYAEALALVRRLRRSWLKGAATLGVMLLVTVVAAVVTGRPEPLILTAVVLVAGGLGLFVGSGPGSAAREARGLLRQVPLLAEHRVVRVIPGEGLHVQAETSSSRVPWSAFIGVHELQRNYLLLHPGSSYPFVLLAKRGVRPPADVDDLARILVPHGGAPGTPDADAPTPD